MTEIDHRAEVVRLAGLAENILHDTHGSAEDATVYARLAQAHALAAAGQPVDDHEDDYQVDHEADDDLRQLVRDYLAMRNRDRSAADRYAEQLADLVGA